MQRPVDNPPEADSLGLDGFAEPDDQGLSLDELSQAYAALLNRGADPYPQPDDTASEPAAPGAATTDGEPPADLGPPNEVACEVTPKTILEAILFVGNPNGDPLTSERIAALMRGVLPREIDDLVSELNAEYRNLGCPYSIVSVDAGYRLELRAEFAGLRDAFYGRIREARLSQSAIDVLAIVAYQQPVGVDVIDRLRGKPSGAILSQLVRRDLLLLERPSDRKARPSYRTTERFLDLFDLDELGELPRSQEIERDF
jgi:segregation and condensation protein B